MILDIHITIVFCMGKHPWHLDIIHTSGSQEEFVDSFFYSVW